MLIAQASPEKSCFLKNFVPLLEMTLKATPPSQACKYFENSGICVTQCPPATLYDPNLLQVAPNPNYRLAAGDICVLRCPGELQDNMICQPGV